MTALQTKLPIDLEVLEPKKSGAVVQRVCRRLLYQAIICDVCYRIRVLADRL